MQSWEWTLAQVVLCANSNSEAVLLVIYEVSFPFVKFMFWAMKTIKIFKSKKVCPLMIMKQR